MPGFPCRGKCGRTVWKKVTRLLYLGLVVGRGGVYGHGAHRGPRRRGTAARRRRRPPSVAFCRLGLLNSLARLNSIPASARSAESLGTWPCPAREPSAFPNAILHRAIGATILRARSCSRPAVLAITPAAPRPSCVVSRPCHGGARGRPSPPDPLGRLRSHFAWRPASQADATVTVSEKPLLNRTSRLIRTRPFSATCAPSYLSSSYASCHVLLTF